MYEVMRLANLGLTPRQIADDLGITVGTVYDYIEKGRNEMWEESEDSEFDDIESFDD